MQSHQKYVCLNPETSVLDSSCPLCSAEMCFCTFETVGIKHMLTLFGPKNILATSNYERHSQKCLKVRCFPALNWLMLDHAVLSDVRQIPGHIQNIQNISNIQQLASNLICQWRSAVPFECVALVRGFSMGFSIARFGCRHLWRLFHSDHWMIRFAKKNKGKITSIHPTIHPSLHMSRDTIIYAHMYIYIYIYIHRYISTGKQS